MREQTSYYAPQGSNNDEWFVVDANNQTLGRLVSQVASIVRGKNKPTYTPSVVTGGNVIIINAEKIRVSGNKSKDKIYYEHSNYPGGLKSISFQDLIQKNPEKLFRLAFRGMLPKNRIGRKIINKIKVYRGSEHPHAAQEPKEIKLRG